LTYPSIATIEEHIQNFVSLYGMAEALSRTESQYQDIFTAFFFGASEAEAHYYSVKAIHADIPNLAQLLGVSQVNNNKLLAASGFGSLGKNDRFMFSKNKFESFLCKNKLERTCELVQRTPKGFGNHHWFLKVGAEFWKDATTPGTKGVGPRIRNIRSLRNSLRDQVFRTTSELKNQEVESKRQQVECSEHKSVDHVDEDEPEDTNRIRFGNG
jgi:hypothetical protein